MLITCRHVKQLHDPFVDGALSACLMAEVHAHLLQCPACQREIELTRASQNIIARDRCEPQLDSGFASRVVASMPRSRSSAGIETRSDRRWRWAGLVLAGSIPAAAAAVFFAVLLWPSSPEPIQPRLVAGTAVEASGVDELVGPTMEVMSRTREAADSLNQLIVLSADGARRGMESEVQGLRNQVQPDPKGDLTIMDVLLSPFDGILNPPPAPASGPEDDRDIVRF